MSADEVGRFDRRDVIKSIGAAGLAGTAGCFGPGGGGRSTIGEELVEENRFVRAIESDIADRHIYAIVDATSSDVAELFLDGAYTLDTEDEFEGRWVEAYDTDDHQTYEFTLRDNLEWSEPYGRMTAEDFVFHVNEVVTHPDNWANHESRSDWFVDDEPAVAEAIDERTFQVELPRPDDLWLYRPALFDELILPKELLEPYYEDYQDGNDDAGVELSESEEVLEFQFAGNLGPYEFDEYLVEDRIVGVKNDDYYMQAEGGDWENAPYFDRYEVRFLGEQATRLGELETGGATWVTLPAAEVEHFEAMRGIDVVRHATPYCRFLVYNQRANGWEEMRTKEVRQAFSYAVDKETIAAEMFHGVVDVAQTFQPEWSDYYDDDGVSEFGAGSSYDPEHARQLLEDHTSAGYGYDGGEFIGPDGEQVTLTFVNRAGQAPVEDSGQYMANQYRAELGFDVEVEQVPGNTMQNEFWMIVDDDGEPMGFNPGVSPDIDGTGRDDFTSARDWDFSWGFGANTYPRTPGSTQVFWTEDGPMNFYGYESEADLGELFDEGTEAEGMDERFDAFGDAFATIAEEQPFNFVGFEQYTEGFLNQLRYTEEPRLDGLGFTYKHNTWSYE